MDTVVSWAMTAGTWILEALAFVGLALLVLAILGVIVLMTGSHTGSGSRDSYPDALKYREVNRKR